MKYWPFLEQYVQFKLLIAGHFVVAGSCVLLFSKGMSYESPNFATCLDGTAFWEHDDRHNCTSNILFLR